MPSVLLSLTADADCCNPLATRNVSRDSPTLLNRIERCTIEMTEQFLLRTTGRCGQEKAKLADPSRELTCGGLNDLGQKRTFWVSITP